MEVDPTTLKQWLYRHMSQHAGWRQDDVDTIPGDRYLRDSAAAMETLATYVQALPESDARLVRLAEECGRHDRPLDELPLEVPAYLFDKTAMGKQNPDGFITAYVTHCLESLRHAS